MAGQIEAKLNEMGIELPEAPPPVADYVPAVRTGNLVYISGQVSKGPEGLITGQLTSEDHITDGTAAPGSKLPLAKAAATLCGLNVLAQLKAEIGDLDHVRRVVKLTGFVNADGTFEQHPMVIDGASSLMVGVFEEKGQHARAAVGCSSLPLGSIVEVEAVFEVD